MNRLIIKTSEEKEILIEVVKVINLNPDANIGMIGELGAGKTSLLKSVLTRIDNNFAKQVSSPTFSYCNIYQEKIKVAHFDLYRLQSGADLIRIDLLEYLNSSLLVVIEWADRFIDVLNECNYLLEIAFEGKDKRVYTFKGIK
ncbi:MAG: tRNA (adenosine(37)-N6)-threonylcarbamoyltransferase complex ATPase subunit type 1 TsaE [SAR324 cluster bacterium]|nr:tRNA (adenosine(37)-N6)-threonylcarbamoyltransferase complex ATPase subunit type 1 TsaE [SAR324 cluster bacterium]